MSNVNLEFGRNIHLIGPRAWAEQVRAQLLAMMMFRTGHVVVTEIWAAHPRRVTIRPYGPSGENADAVGVSWRDETAAGERLRDPSGHVHGTQLGTGHGTSVRVRYTAGRFRADTVLRLPPYGVLLPGVAINGGDDQTVVLLHELSHTLRSLYGAVDGRAIAEANPGHGGGGNFGTPRRFDNTEELFAITVANVFASERLLALRADHSSTVGADGHLNNAQLDNREFWREPTIFRHLETAMHRMPRFAQRIAAIQTAFNPFREIRAGVRPYARLRDWSGRVTDPYSGR